MSRKHGMTGPGNPRAVDGREIVAAIREGRLTRSQFDDWRALRRRAPGFLIAVRERGVAELKPLQRVPRRRKAR